MNADDDMLADIHTANLYDDGDADFCEDDCYEEPAATESCDPTPECPPEKMHMPECQK
jgi:hypothetical protein